MNTNDRPIYLDYNATTPHDPEVVQAMRPFFESEFGNPSSNHAYGITPHRAVAEARAEVASLIGAEPEEIVFTSGGTESDNWAILGTARARADKGRHIVTSVIEHPAVLQTCAALEADGFEITRLAVSAGSACHSDTVKLSPVIEAIGVPIEWARGTIRFSTGKYTTDDEIDRAAAAIIGAWQALTHRG